MLAMRLLPFPKCRIILDYLQTRVLPPRGHPSSFQGSGIKHDEAGEDVRNLDLLSEAAKLLTQIGDPDEELLSDQVLECANGMGLLMPVDR
jgi:hypothetical protein